MNQRQKNKFHKAIKDLTELLQELNAGCENWELRYSNCDGKFHLRKICFDGLGNPSERIFDDTYFPWFYMEE